MLNSTIINETDNVSTKNQTSRIETTHSNEVESNVRKQQLIQQRIDLMNEQKLLKHLIEQQEKLLIEKNVR